MKKFMPPQYYKYTKLAMLYVKWYLLKSVLLKLLTSVRKRLDGKTSLLENNFIKKYRLALIGAGLFIALLIKKFIVKIIKR